MCLASSITPSRITTSIPPKWPTFLILVRTITSLIIPRWLTPFPSEWWLISLSPRWSWFSTFPVWLSSLATPGWFISLTTPRCLLFSRKRPFGSSMRRIIGRIFLSEWISIFSWPFIASSKGWCWAKSIRWITPPKSWRLSKNASYTFLLFSRRRFKSIGSSISTSVISRW